MKLNQKSANPTLIWTIIVILFGAISATAVWQLADREEHINDPEPSKNYTESSSKKEPEAPMVRLPGAEPIAALPGDYTQDDHLWRLVNKSHPLTDPHHRPAQLQFATVASRTNKSNDERSLRADIMPQVEALFAAAEVAGFSLHIGSAFRSYELQNVYYTNYGNVYGQAAADSFSAKPGFSEHQTGLAMDVSTTDNHCYLEECFGDTPAGQWLAAHAHEYGFILRYPRSKDGITDFVYEPWHFRYVGTDLAGALTESGLTLDEAWRYITEPNLSDI